MTDGNGSMAIAHTMPPWGLTEYRVLLRISNTSSINSVEGFRVTVEKSQFLYSY
jgi:hypothetical protein